MAALQLISEHACFGGVQRFFAHASQEIGLPMRFSLYLPPQAEDSTVPAVVYLAGLTCNEETFAMKAGAQRLAAELGLALIAPDSSPRSRWPCGIRPCSSRSRHWRRSARRRSARGGKKRLPAISAPTPAAGRSTMRAR